VIHMKAVPRSPLHLRMLGKVAVDRIHVFGNRLP
jgi:hypothetical protein